ncbi:hypothetical protein D1872_267680 [compost metagenome]
MADLNKPGFAAEQDGYLGFRVQADAVVLEVSLGRGFFQEMKAPKRGVFVILGIRHGGLGGAHNMLRRGTVRVALAEVDDVVPRGDLPVYAGDQRCEELLGQVIHTIGRADRKRNRPPVRLI